MPNPTAEENIARDFEIAKKTYAQWGVDAEEALQTLSTIPLSLHCWQGDDVSGFENPPVSPGEASRQRATTPAGRGRQTSFAPTMRPLSR